MSFPKVDIQLQSGALGRFTDVGSGKAGFVVLMASADEPGDHAFGEVKSYSHLIDMPDELQAVAALQLYFSLADGCETFIMPVVDTTTIASVVYLSHASHYAEKLLDHDTSIRYIGVVGTLLLANLTTALTNAKALAAAYLDKIRPVIVALPYSWVTADVLVDLSVATYNRVAAIVSYAGDEIGLFLGKRVSNQVHRNIGRVKDGALPIASCLLDGHASPQKDVANYMASVETLHNKGYITIRTYVGRTGYFFTDDPLACVAGDYSNVANQAVIDKAFLITYNTYVNEINEDVEVTTDGKLNPGVCKALQGNVETAIKNQMTGEISSVKAFVDESQNILTTQKIEVVLKIVPKGYSKEIVVKLGFDNPAIA
ncbi:MAG: hypothetical protein HC896_00050 [Bacteroidales bacterium]|nr:hypothetical protein [Bacteroidales bacterium]